MMGVVIQCTRGAEHTSALSCAIEIIISGPSRGLDDNWYHQCQTPVSRSAIRNLRIDTRLIRTGDNVPDRHLQIRP